MNAQSSRQDTNIKVPFISKLAYGFGDVDCFRGYKLRNRANPLFPVVGVSVQNHDVILLLLGV